MSLGPFFSDQSRPSLLTPHISNPTPRRIKTSDESKSLDPPRGIPRHDTRLASFASAPFEIRDAHGIVLPATLLKDSVGLTFSFVSSRLSLDRFTRLAVSFHTVISLFSKLGADLAASQKIHRVGNSGREREREAHNSTTGHIVALHHAVQATTTRTSSPRMVRRQHCHLRLRSIPGRVSFETSGRHHGFRRR